MDTRHWHRKDVEMQKFRFYLASQCSQRITTIGGILSRESARRAGSGQHVVSEHLGLKQPLCKPSYDPYKVNCSCKEKLPCLVVQLNFLQRHHCSSWMSLLFDKYLLLTYFPENNWLCGKNKNRIIHILTQHFSRISDSFCFNHARASCTPRQSASPTSHSGSKTSKGANFRWQSRRNTLLQFWASYILKLEMFKAKTGL